jgi:hypothetical protein
MFFVIYCTRVTSLMEQGRLRQISKFLGHELGSDYSFASKLNAHRFRQIRHSPTARLHLARPKG